MMVVAVVVCAVAAGAVVQFRVVTKMTRRAGSEWSHPRATHMSKTAPVSTGPAAAPPPAYDATPAAPAARCPACKANEELEVAHHAWMRKGWWHRKTVDSPGKEEGIRRLAWVHTNIWNEKNMPGFFTKDETKNQDGTWKHTCGLPVGSDLWMSKAKAMAAQLDKEKQAV